VSSLLSPLLLVARSFMRQSRGSAFVRELAHQSDNLAALTVILITVGRIDRTRIAIHHVHSTAINRRAQRASAVTRSLKFW
jgi:hypothetical protein